MKNSITTEKAIYNKQITNYKQFTIYKLQIKNISQQRDLAPYGTRHAGEHRATIKYLHHHKSLMANDQFNRELKRMKEISISLIEQSGKLKK